LAVVGIVVRDSNTASPPGEPPPAPRPEDEAVFVPPVDPDPRLELRFHDDMRFGVLTRQADGKARPKQLTYAADGYTNNTAFRVAGIERRFGSGRNGRWVVQSAPLGLTPDERARVGLAAGGTAGVVNLLLGPAPDGRPRIGRRSVYL